MTSDTRGRFKRWFWRPPRAHGETIDDRQVSVLELFYDLVYVAVIGQAAHHLAEHVTVGRLAEFAVVFALIWIAWINGSLYLELHGREDGRTRSIVFVQMGILVLLAVFTADAAGGWGSRWCTRPTRSSRPGSGTASGVRTAGTIASSRPKRGAMWSAWACRRLRGQRPAPGHPPAHVWAGLGVAWIVGITLAARRSRAGLGLAPTDSLVERFGLFTIIVLGEVVIGVVDGLSVAERDATTIVTGMLALSLGFGFWWIYFDLVGVGCPEPAGSCWRTGC